MFIYEFIYVFEEGLPSFYASCYRLLQYIDWQQRNFPKNIHCRSTKLPNPSVHGMDICQKLMCLYALDARSRTCNLECCLRQGQKTSPLTFEIEVRLDLQVMENIGCPFHYIPLIWHDRFKAVCVKTKDFTVDIRNRSVSRPPSHGKCRLPFSLHPLDLA